jgi:transposase
MSKTRQLTVRQIRRLLRLHHEGTATRQIGRVLGVARSTVQDALARAKDAGLSWSLAETMSEEDLEGKMFSRRGVMVGARRRVEPDWALLARELRRPGVNMTVLWEEHGRDVEDGYGYSRFCDLFRGYERRLSPVMRQHHVAGDKIFVDYSGKRIGICDPKTGVLHPAEIFVAVAGASNYTFAEATWTQSLPDWIGSHVRMLRFYGGCPRLLVPDNLKSGVNKASFYDPEINKSYAKFALHYELDILPARPHRPKDKAKVEAGVRFAQSYILGRLRNRTFFTLEEANIAIAEAMVLMNTRPMRRLGVSRKELFESVEAPALRSLPTSEYEYAEWRKARVNIDYHVEAEFFLYSVPHAFLREEVEVRITQRVIEIFHKGKRIAVHARRYAGRRHGTITEHMPSHHRFYAEWTPERFRRWGADFGPETEGLMIAILATRRQPEQAFRTCLGVLRLYRNLDQSRVEAVSARALAIGALNNKSVASIIAHNLDRRDPEDASVVHHANVRGPKSFH